MRGAPRAHLRGSGSVPRRTARAKEYRVRSVFCGIQCRRDLTPLLSSLFQSRRNSRGKRREIYRVDDDRTEFLRILGRTVTLFRWRLHAYVLMGNHYHLLVETPQPTLSRGMRQLNGLYTQGFNRRHRRVGHLFQGRFKAILVERDAHLLELARYVVLNPVRARVARSAVAWPWSSYRATAGIEASPPWLDTATTLESLALCGHARSGSTRFVSEGKGAGYDPWQQVEGQIYLGGDVSPRRRGEDRAHEDQRRSPRRPTQAQAPDEAEPGRGRTCRARGLACRPARTAADACSRETSARGRTAAGAADGHERHRCASWRQVVAGVGARTSGRGEQRPSESCPTSGRP